LGAVTAPWEQPTSISSHVKYLATFDSIEIELTEGSLGKFRSQTSDNMDRRKSRGGKSQRRVREEKRREEKRREEKKREEKRREEKKGEDQRRERLRRKKMQVREKVGKSRFTAFFQCFVALEGGKVGSLKRRVRSQLAR